jgi:hypothetical protein
MDMTPGANNERRAAFAAANPDVTEDELDALFDAYIDVIAVALGDDQDFSEAADDGRGSPLARVRIVRGLPVLEHAPGSPFNEPTVPVRALIADAGWRRSEDNGAAARFVEEFLAKRGPSRCCG